MDTTPDTDATTPIACTLTTKAAAEQVVDWEVLRSQATGIRVLDGVVRMTFPASMLAAVDDLANRERECCAFLTIETSVADGVLTLDISSQVEGAEPVLHVLAGDSSQ